MKDVRQNLLFLKKKKQKDFCHDADPGGSTSCRGFGSALVIKVLWFFSSEKNILPSLCLLVATAAATPCLAAPAHPNAWPTLQPGLKEDPRAEQAVEQLLGKMTLEDKIGQMVQADIGSIQPADLLHYKLGSILAGGFAAPDNNPNAAPAAWRAMVGAYKAAALSGAGASHPAIPILFGIDAVHGNAKVRGATIYPHNIGLGAAHDPDLIHRIGEATAQEVSAVGIDWAFAPTVAVVQDVRWGRSYESYADDPSLVAAYATAMVTGLQGEPGEQHFLSHGHVVSSAKHFIGDGGTAGGRDQGDTRIDESALRDIHGAGYRAALVAGVATIMASYSSWNGEKSHVNESLLTGVLKQRWGFDGFVVGDWNAQEELPGCTKFSCAAQVDAGVDMVMAPDSWKGMYDNLLDQARRHVIPAVRIDDAVRRILRVKALAGSDRSRGVCKPGVCKRGACRPVRSRQCVPSCARTRGGQEIARSSQERSRAAPAGSAPARPRCRRGSRQHRPAMRRLDRRLAGH